MTQTLIKIDLDRIEELGQEERRMLLLKAIDLGLKPSDINIDRTYLYKLKKGIKPVSDKVLRKVIEYLKNRGILEVKSQEWIRGGPIPAWGRCGASRTPRRPPTRLA